MKIKRFEASNMSDALRMVKREFGEEAVILSAKNAGKSHGIFGKKSSGGVVVTAAIDPSEGKGDAPASAGDSQWQFPELASDKAAVEAKPAGGGSILDRFTPITRTGKQKLRPKLVRLMSASSEPSEGETETGDAALYAVLRKQGVDEALALELAARTAELMPCDGQTHDRLEALVQVVLAKGWIAGRGSVRGAGARMAVFVGPHGVGKTASVAKLAARALLDADERVAILSLDNQRIAGSAELARYADIMGLQMETAGNGTQLADALQRLSGAGRILVDTPGLAPNDTDARNALGRLIKAMGDAEVHLVVGAHTQQAVLDQACRFFAPLGVQRLLPTHLDWTDQIGPLVHQLGRRRMPMSWLGTGSLVPEDIRPATGRELAARLLAVDPVAEADAADESVNERRMTPLHPDSTHPFVANNNSDIFHRTDCKAVRRINEENAILFRDADEALAEGFKPCRMCSNDLLVPKPIDRLARTRYAGSRN